MSRFENSTLAAVAIEPLLGVDGAAERSTRPARGDIGPALDRLGDFLPGQLLMATDFDGTLAPIVSNPSDASALPANLRLIDRLVEFGVHVAVISGRAQHDLHGRLPVRGSRILGENGSAEIDKVETRSLRRFNSKVGRLIARWPGVWLECKPGSSSVHYRAAPERGPSVRAAALPLGERLGLVSTVGRMVVEVRPGRANKANALRTLVDALRPRAVVYAGDDKPDESAFDLLQRIHRPHLAVGVSSAERPARVFRSCDLVVEGPAGMAIFLRELVGRTARGRPV